MYGTKHCVKCVHELLEFVECCFKYHLFICGGTNDVNVLGFDSCEEAAWLWKCKVSCDLLKGHGLFRDRYGCKALFFPSELRGLCNKCAEGHGEHVAQGMKCAGGVPIVLCGDQSIDKEVV